MDFNRIGFDVKRNIGHMKGIIREVFLDDVAFVA